MGLVYLLDTNVISELVRKQPNEQVQAKVQTTIGSVAIASVTWHEVQYGVQRLAPSRRRSRIEAYFANVETQMPILPYNQAAAEWFARERARLSKIGRPASYADGQIAAVAAVNHLIVVTRNVADFADFASITVENWFA